MTTKKETFVERVVLVNKLSNIGHNRLMTLRLDITTGVCLLIGFQVGYRHVSLLENRNEKKKKDNYFVPIFCGSTVLEAN